MDRLCPLSESLNCRRFYEETVPRYQPRQAIVHCVFDFIQKHGPEFGGLFFTERWGKNWNWRQQQWCSEFSQITENSTGGELAAQVLAFVLISMLICFSLLILTIFLFVEESLSPPQNNYWSIIQKLDLRTLSPIINIGAVLPINWGFKLDPVLWFLWWTRHPIPSQPSNCP